MLLNEIKHTADHATGVDPKTKFPVIITKSISYIYKTYQKETGICGFIFTRICKGDKNG